MTESEKKDELPKYDPDFGKGNPGGVLEEFTQRIAHLVEVKPMPEDELKKFVLALCDGRVFTSAHLREHELSMLPMIFMPLALGMFADHTPEEMAKIEADLGVIWEYISEAGPRAINGCPTFVSCRLMHKSDWQRAVAAHKVEMERRKSISV